MNIFGAPQRKKCHDHAGLDFRYDEAGSETGAYSVVHIWGVVWAREPFLNEHIACLPEL